MFPLIDSTRSCRWWLSPQPVPAYRGSRVDGGYIRFVHVFLLAANLGQAASEGSVHEPRLHPTRCPVRQGLETGAPFPVG